MANSTDLVFVTTADLGTINGPTIHVINLVNALASRDHTVVLIAPNPQNGPAFPLSDKVTFEPCTNFRRWRLPGSLSFCFMPARLWKHRKARVLYIRSAPFSTITTDIAKRIASKHVAVEFNGWLADEASLVGGVLGRWLHSALNWAQAREARVADNVRVVTKRLGDHAIEGGTKPANVHVIHTGTRLDVFRPLDRAQCRTELDILHERTVAVFVGNLWPAMDLETAISALQSLAEQGRPIDLIVVGDGPTRSELETRAAVLSQAGAQVRFTGSVLPEVAAQYLGAADIALAPFAKARNEAIGLSPLKIRDYAAAGRIIVSSDLPGLIDFDDEPWFFAAKPEDPAAFAKAIASALDTDRQPAEKRAREFAEMHFGWDGVAAEIAKMVKLEP